MHLNCYRSTSPPWETQNTYKQHSGAVTVKCPFAKKTEATWWLVRRKAVWMSILLQNVKLWDAMDQIANLCIFQKTSKCSLSEITNREELDEQQFNWLILCHKFLPLINQWCYILNNNHIAFLSSASLFFYHKPPYTLYAWTWPRPKRKKIARYVASQGVSFKKFVLTLNTIKSLQKTMIRKLTLWRFFWWRVLVNQSRIRFFLSFRIFWFWTPYGVRGSQLNHYY